jgi:class 3 adenylate cyclase
MVDAVRRYEGYVVQSTGDRILALFGAPVAHEDHPQRAVYAALRMQEELKRCSARLRAAGNRPIEARVGINTAKWWCVRSGSARDIPNTHTHWAHHQPRLANAGACADGFDRNR